MFLVEENTETTHANYKRMQINREKKYTVQAFTCVQDAANQKEFSKVMNRTRGKKILEESVTKSILEPT